VAWKDDLNISISGNRFQANPFDAVHVTTVGSILNGRNSIFEAHDCPSSFYSNTGTFMSSPTVNDQMFTRTAAASNPSRPSFQLPVFLWELKDIPDMIRQGGEFAAAIRAGAGPALSLLSPKKAASANLAYQFGMKPFIEDLKSIASFQDSVEKRRKEMDTLYNSGKRGMRRKVILDTNSESGTRTITLWSTSFSSGNNTVNYTRMYKRWGVVRWKANGNSPYPRSDGELRRRILGLTADNIPLAVWKALPWSWLGDYFVNVSNIIAASNRLVATPSQVSVMTKSVTTESHAPFERIISGNRQFLITGGSSRLVRHQRAVTYTLGQQLQGVLPILSAGQLSTLASLYIQRAR
jgi:hypothetical protein